MILFQGINLLFQLLLDFNLLSKWFSFLDLVHLSLNFLKLNKKMESVKKIVGKRNEPCQMKLVI